MLRWTGILRNRELHAVANASENESSVAVTLRERGLTDKSSLGRSLLLAAKEQTDGIHRQTQSDNHTTLVQNPLGDLHQMLWRAASRKIFRDVTRFALLICSTLVTDNLLKMYDQEPEMRLTGEIPEER